MIFRFRLAYIKCGLKFTTRTRKLQRLPVLNLGAINNLTLLTDC